MVSFHTIIWWMLGVERLKKLFNKSSPTSDPSTCLGAHVGVDTVQIQQAMQDSVGTKLDHGLFPQQMLNGASSW